MIQAISPFLQVDVVNSVEGELLSTRTTFGEHDSVRREKITISSVNRTKKIISCVLNIDRDPTRSRIYHVPNEFIR